MMPQMNQNQVMPMQTSQSSFPPYHQLPPNPTTQPMQTGPYVSHGNYFQGPAPTTQYASPQPDMFPMSQSYPNVYNVAPRILPQTAIDQTRPCISATPIFILPNNCQTQMNPSYPGPTYCPPSFYPYPIPLPMQYDTFNNNNNNNAINQPRDTNKIINCPCCLDKSKKSGGSFPLIYDRTDTSNWPERNPNQNDIICSKKNCPASINLQALASQFLSMQGIIACTATRLILRRIPESDVNSSIDEIVEKSQRCIFSLTKDQLINESRHAQHVNSLINLHMNASPPVNVIPVLTQIQLKINLLKAQVENLINRKLMENQGVGAESTGPIDPMALSMKTDNELREFLVALRNKECEERVNLNFAPYHSQRAVVESRLNNVQKKIHQVEAEFEKRRRYNNNWFPNNTYSSYGTNYQVSPDPFFIPNPSNPKRLWLKPNVGSPETTYDRSRIPTRDTTTSTVQKAEKKEGTDDAQETCPGKKPDEDDDGDGSEGCACLDETSSEESVHAAKKKLRLIIDEEGLVTLLKDKETLIVGQLSANITFALENNQSRGFAGKKGGTIRIRSLKNKGRHVEINLNDEIQYLEKEENDKDKFENENDENVPSTTEEIKETTGNAEKFLVNRLNERSIRMEEPNKVVSLLTKIQLDESCFENHEEQEQDTNSPTILTVIGNHIASFTSLVSKLKLVQHILPDFNSSGENSDEDNNISLSNDTSETNSLQSITNHIKNEIIDKNWRRVICLDLNRCNEDNCTIDSNVPSTSTEHIIKSSNKFWISRNTES